MLEKISSTSYQLARKILADRSFTGPQIERIVSNVKKHVLEEPDVLTKVVDAWNLTFGKAIVTIKDDQVIAERPSGEILDSSRLIPSIASPPKSSFISKRMITMNTIIGDIEPRLLHLRPDEIVFRKQSLEQLKIINNLNEIWLLLYNAPYGFFIQDWQECIKKCYYIDEKCLDLLYDKKQKDLLDIHPIVKAAKVIEKDYDYIRTRYLFAERSGYRTIAATDQVKSFKDRPDLRNLLLDDLKSYMRIFAPNLTIEEYNCFHHLLANHDLDNEDTEIIENLASLSELTYQHIK